MKNEQQSQNLLLKVDPRSTFRNNFFQPAAMFLLRDKLITQGEKRESSTKTCNEKMLGNKLKVFVSRISSPLHETKQKRKQTLESAKYGLEIIFKHSSH